MSTGTPGPWAVCVHAQNHYWVAGQTIGAESPADARRVCDVTDWASPTGLANARLIAAAPELLGALIDARSMLAVAIKGAWEGSTDADVAEHIGIKRIDACIAKATEAA